MMSLPISEMFAQKPEVTRILPPASTTTTINRQLSERTLHAGNVPKAGDPERQLCPPVCERDFVAWPQSVPGPLYFSTMQGLLFVTLGRIRSRIFVMVVTTATA
jgi:hypothetical protein